MTDIGVEWHAAALLVIDVQNDFIDGAAPVPGTQEILPALTELITAFRAAQRPIAHLIRFYEPGGSDVDLPRRAAVQAGAMLVAPQTPGAQIPPALTGNQTVTLASDELIAGEFQQLSSTEVIAYKPRWSGFYRTRLEQWLREQSVTSVLVAGCNLPNCPRATLFDASERDFRAALVADAVSQVTPERLSDLGLIGVSVLTVSQVRQGLC